MNFKIANQITYFCIFFAAAFTISSDTRAQISDPEIVVEGSIFESNVVLVQKMRSAIDGKKLPSLEQKFLTLIEEIVS